MSRKTVHQKLALTKQVIQIGLFKALKIVIFFNTLIMRFNSFVDLTKKMRQVIRNRPLSVVTVDF